MPDRGLTQELQAAKELSIEAGGILLQHYSAAPDIRWKGTNDPVTSADVAASRFLVEELKRRFPDDGILSEEELDDSSRLTRPRVWMIDPMDGTKEYIARRGEFSVMIGLSVEGIPTAGVVYQPTVKKLYYGALSTGAFLEEERRITRLQVSNESDFSQITAAISRSHPSERAKRIRQELGIRQTLSSGSAGLKVGLICEGRAHLYVHMGSHTFQWDTCAPQAILHAAGGRMTDMMNSPLRYNTPDPRNPHGLAATNGMLHDRVIAALRKLA